ncbi:hypothetical protein H257_06024 [Aphanomyces astaci]|uniref:U1-type domain-containing protein n=2 Tax=Aphanomyces astaci TaxID=112090 RepID=W4GP94_APHAT|nr:hypothetical protein H257_06024 [Aphanomyces astaci]ETV81532.1 hypothetical protein H257_06024 [Aphanomyces astaci]|eukprot:XP_009829390.1 hypothetical protein H257_06024 [Aphanomyces astaci]
MSDQPKKGVANVTRKTWDKAFFEQQAALRASGALEEEEKKTKKIDLAREEFQPAAEDAAGPAGSVRAFLKARTKKVELDSNVGKTTVIKPDDAMRATGYYCEVCEVTLKDSISYIDHVNGKKHLRKLGFSMRVEQSSVASVKDRLNAAAKRKWDPEITKKLDAVEAYEKKLAALDEEAQAKKAKRKEAKAPTPAVDVFASAEEEAMMAAMGFGGFNSTKKK